MCQGHETQIKTEELLEEINKTWQLNLVCDHILDPELGKVARKDNIHKSDKFEYVLWIIILYQF